MGCQVSRLEQDHEDRQPARPGLFRRLEDVGRRSRSERAISEKQQPNDEKEGGDEDEKVCTTKHNDKDVNSHNIPVVSINGHIKAHSLDGLNLKMIVDSDEEKDKEGENYDREDHLFGPRSPSFREYCVNFNSRELDMDDDGHVEEEKGEDKSTKKEGSNAPPHPNEGSRTKVPKKRLKRRSFRKVLTKDGSLKNLWNSNCYNPSFSFSDEKPQKEQGGKVTHDRRHSSLH